MPKGGTDGVDGDTEKAERVAKLIVHSSWFSIAEYAALIARTERRRFSAAACVHDPEPEHVYHYASPESAAAIIASRDLHLSASANLNDPGEGDFGKELLRTMIWEKALPPQGDELECAHDITVSLDSELQASLQQGALLDSTDISAFLICFSKPEVFEWFGSEVLDCDNLPLWRMYSDDCRGVALRFRHFDLARVGARHTRFAFYPVIYNGHLQERFLRMVYAHLNVAAQADPHMEEAFRLRYDPTVSFAGLDRELLASLTFRLALLLIKHPSYHHEGEHRLLYLGDLDWQHCPDIQWKGEHAYVSLKEQLGLADALSVSGLEALVFGPAATPRGRNSVLRGQDAYVAQHGIQILKSSLPYRPAK